MLRTSFIVVFIQILGMILGLMSIYIIAGDMAPEVYSLVGIYTIVNSVILTFSNLGIETTMMREALYWLEIGDIEKVREYCTQSILSRLMGFVILMPLIISYLIYLDYVKYGFECTLLFISFFVGSCISALNDSISLIIRSQGGFVFAQFAQTLNNNAMKFVSILVYIKFGAQAYLYFFALYSIPLLFVFVYRLKDLFSIRYFRFKDTLQKIIEAKYLFLRSYLDFFKNYADSILVSLLFPTTIMGSYSLFKNFENLIRNVEDGFFDVLSQNIVKYKGNYDAIRNIEKKYNITRLVAVILIIICIFLFDNNKFFIVNALHLSHYDAIEMIIFTAMIVAVLNLLGKYEISALSLLASSKLNLIFGVLCFLVAISTISLLFIQLSLQTALLQRCLVPLIVAAIGVCLFYPNRKLYYTNLLK